MSGTRKRIFWGLASKWRGVKQNKRDRLRNKLTTERDSKFDGHSNYEKIAMSLLSKGCSLEKIREHLATKHRCHADDMHKVFFHINNTCKICVENVVCMKNNHMVPASISNLDPCFLVHINLPIYNWLYCDRYFGNSSSYGGGCVIYSDNTIYKFSSKNNKNMPIYVMNEDKYMDSELEIWPHEKMTHIVREIIEIHINSGMKSYKFNIHGWQNLRYLIEVVG